MAGFDVFCWHCAARGTVNRVTATLRCGCGSNDVDLWDGGKIQRARVAAVHEARFGSLDFADFMTTAASKPVGTEIPGWNVYQGPAPGPNDQSVGLSGSPDAGQGPNSHACPVCHGNGFDLQDGGPCRECGGDGKLTPNTTPEVPQVARHNYPSTQTKVPFMGQRRDAVSRSSDPMGSVEEHIRSTTPDYSAEGQRQPETSGEFKWKSETTHFPRADEYSPNVRTWQPKPYTHQTEKPFEMPGAFCPTCAHEPTQLVKDYKDEAHWTCPNCGPLANIDRHPEIDPYNVSQNFKPMDPKRFRASKKVFAGKKTGMLMARVALIGSTNPGLTVREVITLARNATTRYPEAN